MQYQKGITHVIPNGMSILEETWGGPLIET
jgi:hypothetical protein